MSDGTPRSGGRQAFTRQDVEADTVREEGAAAALVEKLGGAPPVVDWDRYELLELLGRGGMGAVYKARDKRLDRLAAVKFIHSPDPYTTMRFLQEARAQARVEHPNVCKVLEVGEVSGKAYIAMQLIDGLPLSKAAETMTIPEKVRVIKVMAEAVHEAHRLGVIHRDIKPANIMVEEIREAEGPSMSGAPGHVAPSHGPRTLRPVLMDFGLAREAGDGHGLTESGAVMGTPSYMPPEQARGDARRVDARSDVYSLGATLYHLLAGVPPFVQDETGNVLLKVLVQDPVPLKVRAPDLPEALDVIVGKCLNKEPHQRYATAAELAEDLDRFLNRERVRARRLGLVSRLYWRGRRNPPMAVAVVALALCLFAFAGYGVRTTIVNARNEALARKRTELAQKLGQSVKDLEWLMRSAHLVPLHDVTPEKALVRSRMTEIEAEMRSFGDLAAGLDHYALGRGHLALEAWDDAQVELSRAELLGVREPELDYALGRVLGELYSRALEDARRSGDKSYFEKRKLELDQQYRAPALDRLTRCRGLRTVSASYLDGLIAFYDRRYDDAQRDAETAGKSAPWLYEAPKLAGDVAMARALDARDHGDNEEAARRFDQAVTRYGEAAEIGRSDHEVYEALAEAWIRQEETGMFRGKDPEPDMQKALGAADKALIAAPLESNGHTKKAFAYNFQAEYAQNHGATREVVERLRGVQIAVGEQGVALHPGDAYAQDITGIALLRLAEYLLLAGQPERDLLDRAYVHLEAAIRINPRFPWAYNDYGYAMGWAAYSKKLRNEDPEALFRKAIDTIEKATAIDDQYTIAFNNMSVWLTELADWQAEHGKDPGAAVQESVQMADRAIGINRQNPLAYANAGLALAKIASYRLDTGQDGREPARAAVDRFKAVAGIDPTFVFGQCELGRAYLLLGTHDRAAGVDPRASLDAGGAAVAACLRLEPGNVDGKSVEAQLRAEAAAWAQQRSEPFLPALEEAEKLATEAAQKAPDRGELWLAAARIGLAWADALAAGASPPSPPGPVVDRGLGAVERALQKAPGLPRALAVQGALLVRKAQQEKDEAARAALLAKARASLGPALSGNPLLRRRYGAAAAAAGLPAPPAAAP